MTHRMKSILLLIFCCLTANVLAQKAGDFNGLNTGMGNLYQFSNAKIRSISAESPTDEKGKGGMATLEEGMHSHQARELGVGWKVNPFVRIEAGTTFTLLGGLLVSNRAACVFSQTSRQECAGG